MNKTLKGNVPRSCGRPLSDDVKCSQCNEATPQQSLSSVEFPQLLFLLFLRYLNSDWEQQSLFTFWLCSGRRSFICFVFLLEKCNPVAN